MLSFGYALAANADGVGDGGEAVLGVGSFRRIMAPFYTGGSPATSPGHRDFMVSVSGRTRRKVPSSAHIDLPDTLPYKPHQRKRAAGAGTSAQGIEIAQNAQTSPLTFNLDLVV